MSQQRSAAHGRQRKPAQSAKRRRSERQRAEEVLQRLTPDRPVRSPPTTPAPSRMALCLAVGETVISLTLSLHPY